MSWIYCKCGQGLDRPTPRQVLLKEYVCPNCGADNNGHVSDGEAVLDLFDSRAPSAPPTLQGLLVNNWRSEMSDELFTPRAYRLADAMLEARK